MVSPSQMDTAGDVVIAEAAAWLARLQGPARTPATEAAFKEWLAADPAHARAFSRATDVWEALPGAVTYGQRRRAKSLAWSPVPIAAVLCLAVAGLGAVGFVLHSPSYRTAVGEQRTVALADGSTVTLNTNSRLVVDYRAHERRVRLTQGEAVFQVAKNPARPFIVQAGDEQVRALGTTFVVRDDPTRIAVTLIEGRVVVSKQRPGAARLQIAVLKPGDRLTTLPALAPTLDRPRAETIAAWQRGEVMFDDITLADAVAELNRYGDSHIDIADPALSSLRVSGVFQTHNPAEFADAMAQLYGLRAGRDGEQITLTR